MCVCVCVCSYKLWYRYLKLRRKQVRRRCVTDPVYEEVNNAFERALVFMHKVRGKMRTPHLAPTTVCVCVCVCVCSQMPRIWLDYCQFLMDQKKVTKTRRTFDRALQALPLTQHNRIWPLYIQFVRSHNLPETAIRVYRRHLKVNAITVTRYVHTYTLRQTQQYNTTHHESHVSFSRKGGLPQVGFDPTTRSR